MGLSQLHTGPSRPYAPEIFERKQRLVLSANISNCNAPKKAGVPLDWGTPAQSKRALSDTNLNVQVLKRRRIEKHNQLRHKEDP